MTLRARIGLIAAVLFTLLNVVAVWYAGMQGEIVHAAGHVVLAFAGAFVAWYLSPRRVAIR